MNTKDYSLNEIRSIPNLALEFAKFMNDNERELLDAENRMKSACTNILMNFESRLIEFAIYRKTTKVYAVNQIVENKEFPTRVIIESNYVLFDETELDTAKHAANFFKAEIREFDFSRILLWSDDEFEFMTIGKQSIDLARKYRKLMRPSFLAKQSAAKFK